MANPTFQQKKDWGRGKNLEPAPAKPSWVQSLWASTPGRLAQGSLIDDAMGLAQMAVRMEEPVIPLRMGQPDPYRDAAVNAVDGWVSDVERNYRDARIAAGQDVTGIDWTRGVGSAFDPLNYLVPQAKAPSLLGRAAKNALANAGQSAVASPVDTQKQSYGQGKLEDAARDALVGGALPFAKAGLAKIVDPKIDAGSRALLDEGVPLTLGQTLGGATQRLESRLADLPVVGPPIRAAQQRAIDGIYDLRMDADSAPVSMRITGKASPLAESLSDLRSIPAPARPAVGLTGLLSNVAYSKPGQAVLRTVISNRPEGVGLIGDYLRDEIGHGAFVRGLLSGPR
jgi:hypothetical protein